MVIVEDTRGLQVDNITLLNAAFSGDTNPAGQDAPAIVSGLMKIGLQGADGSKVDPLPFNSMSALLPLSQGYNASEALFCVEVITFDH